MKPPPERILSTMTTALPTFWARLRTRLQFFTQPAALPVVLLLLALSTVFLFGNDRDSFYREGHHDWLTAQYLAQTVNLSLEHNFLPFVSRTLNADGKLRYVTYARWPVGSLVLGKLAILPFGEDFSAQIYAVRIVMLLLFSGSALLAYGSFARLIADRWVALVATLATFSSYYSLYYNDVYAPDVIPALFGVMLTGHGMVRFVQEGHFRQFLMKACVSALLCWHVYALLLPYIVLSLVGQLIKARSSVPARLDISGRFKHYGAALLAGRHLTLGAVTLLWGISILSFNVLNVYFALDKKLPLTEVPLLKSLAARLGLAGEVFHDQLLEWPAFLSYQFGCIAKMTFPFIANPFSDHNEPLATSVGIFILCICLVGATSVRVKHKVAHAAFIATGFCWSLPLRRFVVFHDFQSIFYIGISLTCISFVLLCIRKLSGRGGVQTLAVLMILLFVLSSAKMADVGHDDNTARAKHEILEDFETIRNIVDNHVVYIGSDQADPWFGAPLASTYFLAGAITQFEDAPFSVRGLIDRDERRRQRAEFLLSRIRFEGTSLLTPHNRRAFLYDRALYDAQYEEYEKMLGDPLISSDYNVYFKDDQLLYIRDECKNIDLIFFLHVFPVDVSQLPAASQQHGYENLDFSFAHFADKTSLKCTAIIQLPEYDIARIRTGQYSQRTGRVWEGTYDFDRSSLSGEPKSDVLPN